MLLLISVKDFLSLLLPVFLLHYFLNLFGFLIQWHNYDAFRNSSTLERQCRCPLQQGDTDTESIQF